MKSIQSEKIMILLLSTLAIAFMNGCVTNAAFQETIHDQNAKIQAAQNTAEANVRRIESLKVESKGEFSRLDSRLDDAIAKGNEALKRAESAEKLAKGKVIYKVVLSNDAGRFAFDKYELSAELKSILDDLANMIKSQNKQVFIEIQGHTDNVGSEAHNMELGLKRAQAVRRYFNEINMLPLHMIHAISYGESSPLADNSTKEGRAQNRRVIIMVLE